MLNQLMDNRLTDLDALILTVRNPFSRSYIDEAVRAYRAGSLKAGIVAIWVAVSYDIIEKIRELADDGDQAAKTFVRIFDINVAANNVAKLLEIESSLLDEAETRFQFIDPIARRHFDRLKQDRNLCAHPAFTLEGQLFAPEPELIRLYLVEAIRNLLSQRPMQGKTVFSLFDRDIRGTAFPTDPDAIVRFVENRYLANTRRTALASFATVLAKALLKATPDGWVNKIGALPWALQAVKLHDAAIWTNNSVPTLVRLIESADDEHLPNAFPVLRLFSEILAGLPAAAGERLLATVENAEPLAGDVRVYEAGGIARFEAAAVEKFSTSPRHVQVTALNRFPFPGYWPASIRRLREAMSYRNAEQQFSGFISPFGSVATVEQMLAVFEVLRTNGQVSFAADVPELAAAFVRAVSQRHLLEIVHLSDTLASLEKQGRREYFEEMLDEFRKAGVQVPAPVGRA